MKIPYLVFTHSCLRHKTQIPAKYSPNILRTNGDWERLHKTTSIWAGYKTRNVYNVDYITYIHIIIGFMDAKVSLNDK